MQLILPHVELLKPQFDETSVWAHVVRCAQTCYKVDKEVTDPWAWISEHLLKNEPQHCSPLEHGTFYLTITLDSTEASLTKDDQWGRKMTIVDFYEKNKYSHVNVHFSDHTTGVTYYITTNGRVIVENNRFDDLDFLTKPFKRHEKRYTLRFTCDIGVSREANRHRTISPSEQSTRYCNYSRDRFGNELSVVLPTDLFDVPADQLVPADHLTYCQSLLMRKGPQWQPLDWWFYANLACETAYMNLIRLGWKPQQARRILPLDTQTEVVYTAFEKDWNHFLYLRDDKAAHPDMRFLARQVRDLLRDEMAKYK